MPKAGKWIVGPIAVQLCLAVTFVTFSQEPQTLEPVDAVFEYDTNAVVRLDEISAEIASLKEQLAKKADKSDDKAKKGWSAPKIGGRFFMDYVNSMNNDWDGLGTIGPGTDSTQNWFGMREARIAVTGTGYDFLDYKLELGFEKSASYNASYKDIFLGIKNVPLFEYVRIGHQYVEDAGSEICNGTTNYTFMEAPAPAGEHFTSRRVGVTSRHLFAGDRGRLFLGVYDAQSIGDGHFKKDDNQGIVLNARLTYSPYFCHEGRNMLLFGAYYRYTDVSDATITISRPKPGGWDVYESNNFGFYYIDHSQKAGFEAVYQRGRLCLQTDLFMQHYTNVHYDAARLGDKTNYGGFVMARWFLTKDFRKYNQGSACWDGVNVGNPFRFVKHCDTNYPCGLGAWEVAAMYGFYDHFRMTAPADIADSKLQDQQIGVALNWYWNPHVKWAVNYIHDISDVKYADDDYSPTGDYLGMSCRVAF